MIIKKKGQLIFVLLKFGLFFFTYSMDIYPFHVLGKLDAFVEWEVDGFCEDGLVEVGV